MSDASLTDEQWCVLDLLMRAREKGVQRLHRRELLYSQNLPQTAAVRLVWAALTMPKDIVDWHSHYEFSVTEGGAALYNFKFSQGQSVTAKPSRLADEVIYLPGPEHYVQ